MPNLITAIEWFFNVLYVVLFIRILLSWFPHSRGRFAFYIYRITEPILSPVRKVIQRSPLGGPGMMIDFSVIFTLLLMFLLRDFIIQLLVRLM